MTEFSQLTLHPALVQAAAQLGFSRATEVQASVIPLLLAGADVLAQSQTGSGKTAAFAFPILNQLIETDHREGVTTLVLTPTRELAIQVADAFQDYAQGIKVSVFAIYGGQHYGTSRRRLKEGVDIVVGTPGRLQDLLRQGLLDLAQVKTVILDEADEMLSMGFSEDVENILRETPSQRQTALFSATLPKAIRDLADKYLQEPETILVQRQHMTVSTIEQRYYLVNEGDKLAALTRIFEAEEVGSTLVFTRTRKGSGKLANDLVQLGFPAEALNGDLAQDARIRVLTRFREGQIKVLVATDVAARGLDIDDITHVVNFDIPHDPEAYVHRIGRTGRAGKQGTAISFFTPRERSTLRRIEAFTKHPLLPAQLPTEKDLLERRDLRLLEKMEVWLERDRCKHEEELASYLAASGYDPIKIAAAALKMARQANQESTIARIQEASFQEGFRSPRSGKNPARKDRKSFGKGVREKGMVRLSLSRGRVHGINPGEIVGGIASLADIPGSGIGKIIINDKYSLIDVKEEFVPAVLKNSGSYHFRSNRHVSLTKTGE